MSTPTAVKEYMRELGKKSAAKRKEKYGEGYMKTVQKLGAEARRKNEHKSEPLTKEPQKDKNMRFSID